MKDNFNKFWVSFEAWFLYELPYSDMLKGHYKAYNNWNGGTYYIDIDYAHLYRLHYGYEWTDIFSNNNASIESFKPFIEVIYDECIEDRYPFTVTLNEKLKKFKVPYRLQSGKFIKEGYRTTVYIDKIVNYEMCERKIRFSEEMISSRELLDKKVALDYIVDALQFLVSISSGEGVKEKYKAIALSIAGDCINKKYAVILAELNEIMKISNEYFDIRHNEYINKAKEKREALNESSLIEYLYNRVYALTFIIRQKSLLPKVEEERVNA
jgi:hypothetical protein